MKRMGAVESDSVKLARKAKDKLHKACERASELVSDLFTLFCYQFFSLFYDGRVHTIKLHMP